MNNTYKTNKTDWRRLVRSILFVALLLAALPAEAQEACGYIIYTANQGHYMAHNEAGTSQQDATSFDPGTCLWNVNNNQIRPCDSDGNTLGNYYLKPNNANFAYSTGAGTWTSAAAGGTISNYYNNRTYYLRYSGGWEMSYSTNNTGRRATIYAVTKTTDIDNFPEAYNATLTGTTTFFTQGATATYAPAGTHTAAYTITTITYTYNGSTELGTATTGSAATPTAIDFNDGWTLSWSLSDDTYASINSSGTLTVNTSPATVASTTVQFTATKGSTTINASLPVTIYASEEIYDNIFGGTTGISDGVVTLNDYENHGWTYYSDASSPVHRLNPVNIQITYYGYGTKTMTSSNTDQLPANNQFTENVANTAVKVNQNEEGHTFVYYKTLENANDDGTGNYPYIMIPNPFQVRPTHNSDWRGFYAWRVKSLSSGLSIKVDGTTYTSDDIGDGIIIYAEQEVEFITANEYGNKVAFEALWAKAYLDDGSNYYTNTGNYRNAYERNFKKVTSLTTYNYPVTISSINPDGSGTVGSVSRTSNYTCSNDVKLENMTLGMANYYIDGNSYNLAIGRGVANGNNNVASSVYGDASPSSVMGDFTLRVESGKYSTSYILYATNGTNNTSTFTATAIYGSDYDRANATNNNKLVFSSVVEVGINTRPSSANTAINVTVLSGTFGSNAANNEFYMGYENCGTNNTRATRKLEVFGGNFLGGIAGGIEYGVASATNNLTMRIHDGTIHRYLYGSGQYSAGYGTRRIVITGGTFDAWVAGGCYGTNPTGGATNGNINLYFGGDANQSNTDGIFGAGYGSSGTSDNSYTVIQSNVVFADEATTTGSVYGGGNKGYATGDIKVYLAGGTVGGNVFGGANEARSSADVAVVVTGGTVAGGVYGGSNQSGAISGQITVDVYGTDPAPSANAYAINQVFGGGNVAAYTGTPVVTVHNDSSCNISIGEVYGGGLGTTATVTGTNVTIEAGNIIGDVYGGGRQAPVGNGGTSVTVNGGTIRRVFGGNNVSGAIADGTAGKITVNVDKTSSCPMKIGQVFGGGNQAGSQVGSITVGCTGTLVNPLADGERYGYDQEGIGAVYGGANNAAIDGNITLNIVSGIVDSVFGGNNAGGSINGDITVNINKNGSATCASDWYVGYVFGGGNMATYSQKTADHPAVNVQAGLVTHHVFGGGNGSGATVTGNPTVTLSGTAHVGGNVYGGGNAAPVTGNTNVHLQD